MLFTNMRPENKRALWGISILNFLWATASLMVFSILPAFMVDVLKLSTSHIGIVEGLAISSSFLSKFFSGIYSDIQKNRKPLIMIGTILNVLTKLSIFLASSAYHVFAARFFDRLSKGIRAAPTDALVADISPQSDYAASFGLKQSFCSLGAVLGALLSMALMLITKNDYQTVFLMAIVPALLAIIVAWYMVRPHKDSHPRNNHHYKKQKITLRDLKEFPLNFWLLMLGIFFLMLARFSEAFLLLKAKDVGLSVAYLPLLLVFMDLVHAMIAFPVGRRADKLSRNLMMVLSLAIFFLADIVMFIANDVLGVTFGFLLVGIHCGISQGVMRALIAELTVPHLRGTAFSLFFVISGIAIFIGNSIAGFLSDHFGVSFAFLGGGFFAFLATIIVFAQSQQKTLAKNLQPI